MSVKINLFAFGSWVQVKKSWLDVQLCKDGTQDCDASASNDTTVGGVLKFPKHSNEEMVFNYISLYLLSCLSI